MDVAEVIRKRSASADEISDLLSVFLHDMSSAPSKLLPSDAVCFQLDTLYASMTGIDPAQRPAVAIEAAKRLRARRVDERKKRLAASTSSRGASLSPPAPSAATQASTTDSVQAKKKAKKSKKSKRKESD